jgi:hypothetical protein
MEKLNTSIIALDTKINLHACLKSICISEWYSITLFTMMIISYTASYYRSVIKREDHRTIIQLLSKNMYPLAIME